MNERDLWWKITIVGGLIALSFASVYPLERRMKFGIDLYGGYSLLYEIDDTGLEGPARSELSQNVMRVLRERVDPKGVFNLVWRPVGHNRLEIQMPRPSENVRKARARYEELQEQIRSTVLRRSDVLRLAAKDPAERPAVLAGLVGNISGRHTLLESAAKAYVELQAMQQAYDARVAEIEKDNLKEEDIRAVVSLPAEERAAALERLVGPIPARKELLDAAAAAWDAHQSARAAASQPAEGQDSLKLKAGVQVSKARFDRAVQAVLDANIDPNALTEGATIDEVVRLDEALDDAVSKVLATNIDLGRLQTLLEMDPTESEGQSGIATLTREHPGLTDLIDGLVEATGDLRKRRKGEGRLEDPADLQRLLRGAGVLEFRILPANDRSDPAIQDYREALKKRGPRPKRGEDAYQWFEIEDPADFMKIDNPDVDFESRREGLIVVCERFGDKYYVLSHIGERYALTHRLGVPDWSLTNASFRRDENGMPAIGFELDQRGGSKFGVLTQRHKEKQLCIFLDDQAISSARINDVITTSGIIQGDFTSQQVFDMVRKLNAGSLPKKLKDPPISIRSIGPSLGEANRTAGLKAAQYGAICVAIFMLLYYFYSGAIAVIAVGINLLFIGATMSALGATLTLPGIAGLVLAIGMAVDANVLINERIREELARGTALRMAFRLGYERAFRAILDSNVTTVLTCVILYMVGSEEVKGFGLTLGIGVFVNIFTAYFVTRMFFDLMAMVSVPREVLRYPIYLALGVTAFGAALYGLGYWLTDETTRHTSVSIAFGQSVMYVGPAIMGLLLLMNISRAVHDRRSNLPMLRLIGVPKVNWVGRRYVFFGISAILLAGSVFAFTSIERDNLYDIEFLGGTGAQIDLKQAGSLDQAEISQRLAQSGATLERFAEAMTDATVAGSGGMYTFKTPGVPAARLEPVLRIVAGTRLSQTNPITASDPASEEVTIQARDGVSIDPEALKGELAARFRQAAESIAGANVQRISGFQSGGEEDKSFSIVTRETAKEIVVGAIMETMKDEIDVQPALTFKLLQNADLGGPAYFPIHAEDPEGLGVSLTDRERASVDLQGWQGGVAIAIENANPPQRVEVLQKRLKAMRLQPGFEKYGWRESKVFGLTPAAPGSDLYNRLLVVVRDENYPLEDEQGALSALWQANLAEPEVELLQSALQRQTSLSQVTQFDKQVSGEAQVQAYLALALSWFVIIVYVWFRFGNIRWGLAAVTALIHDVVIAVGFVSISYYLAKTVLGEFLMISEGFRIDLALVAAMLTVIGYSVNDTIVVFDRIRENRGRMKDVTTEMVNDSVSQTLSRTVLTLLTSLISVFIMYIFGGRGIHAFSYVLIIGLAIGTYSSIGVASQFLVRRRVPVTA